MNSQFKKKIYLLLEEWTEEWMSYFFSFFRLYVLIPVGIVLLFIFYGNIIDEKSRVILEIFIAFFGGIAGTQFVVYLNKKSAKKEIRQKASSAIRNLYNIEERLKNVIGRIKVDSDIGEIRNLVIMLQANVNNAKDDWNDIIDISEIDKYREKRIKAGQEKEELLKKINDDKSEKENLSEELKNKDLEIEKIQAGFDNYKNTNNLNMLGDVSVSPSLNHIGSYICERCHEPYYRTRISVGVGQDFVCEKCKLKAGNYVQ